MPEYLAPGVYVEEVSFRSKSIEGVSTTTTAFVGPTRYGPVDLVPDVITGLAEYERIYGDRQQLDFGDGPVHNYMWHAVRQFFENGGKRLFVARVFHEGDSPVSSPAGSPSGSPPSAAVDVRPGHAMAVGTDPFQVWARFPGVAGNVRVRITLNVGPNIFQNGTVKGLSDFDVVMIDVPATLDVSPSGVAADLYIAQSVVQGGGSTWRFEGPSSSPPMPLGEVQESVRVVTMTVTIFPVDPGQSSLVYPNLAPDSRHRRSGADDSLAGQFAEEQPSLGRARSIPIVMDLAGLDGVEIVGGVITLADTHHPLTTQSPEATFADFLADPASSDAQRSWDFALQQGNDGALPEPDDYVGTGGGTDPTAKSGLKALEDIDDISIVAAPGSTANYADRTSQALTIIGALITHAEQMHYRIAVIDSGDGQSIADVRELRGKIDSTYAAFYYPWLTVNDPVTRADIQLPPSGAVAGIYARNDVNRGVFKAPANEVVDGVIGLEKLLNKGEQDILNPLGINCFRFFEGRGHRLWGARTATSDPEWKYVNLRRFFNYLKHSIDKGTQWAVFEPNGERLWANIRITVSNFLFNEWVNGALLGDKPEKAFFVRCDRSTMTQNDLDNGRLVVLVGVAALRPAEFVIIRIGQWTADRT